MDFFLDANWKVYLLEINLSPAVTHTDDARMRVQTGVVRDLVAAFGLGAADPRPAHAPPRPINAYAIVLKTSYAWTRKRLGAAAPDGCSAARRRHARL